jgi:ABC-type branched-subunit amino acid transport system ATPase component
MAGISKRFPGVMALDKVDFEVAPGEIHALLGENGAGKSTLLKILSGAQPPDEGTIELAGTAVTMASPHDAQKAWDRHDLSGVHARAQHDGWRERVRRAGTRSLAVHQLSQDGVRDPRPHGSYRPRCQSKTLVRDLAVAEQQMVSKLLAPCRWNRSSSSWTSRRRHCLHPRSA